MLLAEFVKFALIGTAGFIIDAATLTLLRAIGMGLLTGRVCSFLLAASCTWYGNRHFTFRRRPAAPAARQWPAFVAVNSIGAAANYATYAALVTTHPFVAQHPVLGVAAGSLAGLAWNFSLSRAVVFRGG